MRSLVPAIIPALELSFIVFLCACDSGTSVSSQGYRLQGSLTVEGGADPSLSVVAVYPIPADEQLSQAIIENPGVGFTDYVQMLFDPWSQDAVASTQPSVSGAFGFDNLAPGNYIISAELDGYACPDPKEVMFLEDTDIGSVSLTTLEEIGGVLAENTIWSTGEAYLLSQDLIVPSGLTLTIAPSVIALIEEDVSIIVSGSMIVEASASQPVRMWASHDIATTGGSWGGIDLDQPSDVCSISGLVVRHAMTGIGITSGTLNVDGCLFEMCDVAGVSFGGLSQGVVQSSIVKDGFTGLASDQSSPEFHHNLILRLSGSGIELKSVSQAALHHNAVIDCGDGIWSSGYGSSVIEYNLISGGVYALYAESGFTGVLRYNDISNPTSEGLYLYNGCYPVINDNNFHDMPQVILRVNGNSGQQADTVFALMNYWDGEGLEGIPERIIDGRDIGSQNNPVGPVEFNPFRLQMVSGAGP